MTIDWTLDIGSLLTVLMVVGTIATIIITNKTDIRALGDRLKSLEGKIGELAEVLTVVAGQKERLDGHALRLDRLERQIDGKG